VRRLTPAKPQDSSASPLAWRGLGMTELMDVVGTVLAKVICGEVHGSVLPVAVSQNEQL
jgi:hypothetical protein